MSLIAFLITLFYIKHTLQLNLFVCFDNSVSKPNTSIDIKKQKNFTETYSNILRSFLGQKVKMKIMAFNIILTDFGSTYDINKIFENIASIKEDIISEDESKLELCLEEIIKITPLKSENNLLMIITNYKFKKVELLKGLMQTLKTDHNFIIQFFGYNIKNDYMEIVKLQYADYFLSEKIEGLFPKIQTALADIEQKCEKNIF